MVERQMDCEVCLKRQCVWRHRFYGWSSRRPASNAHHETTKLMIFLSRPLSTFTLHREGYSHWVGLIHSTWIRTKHFSFVMAWIRKGLWDSEEPDVAFAFALGLLIPRARPAPLSFPGISFPPWEVRCILGITGRSVMFGVLLFLLGMVRSDLALGFRGYHGWDMDYLCRMHTYWLIGESSDM